MMQKRSFTEFRFCTTISKNQYPNLTKEILSDYFYNQLRFHHHGKLTRKGEYINFNNSLADISPVRFRNRWKSYSSGEFKIYEEGGLIIISFIGSLLRGIKMAAIPGIALTALSLFIVLKERCCSPSSLYLYIVFFLQWLF